jgi:CDP-diacylglycerol--glycerol-3-phosphate 3-phosphatidyltransferase
MDKMVLKQLPNILSIVRIILVVPFACFIFIDGYIYKLVALGIFSVASITDYLDGFFARKYNLSSQMGRFLDPLADKILVITAFIVFLIINPDIFLIWLVFIIIFREVFITILRIWAIKKEKELETMRLGKAKTTAQITTILVIIILLAMRDFYYGMIGIDIPPAQFLYFTQSMVHMFEDFGYFLAFMPHVLMFVTTILTVVSGTRYVYKNRKLIVKRTLAGRSTKDE